MLKIFQVCVKLKQVCIRSGHLPSPGNIPGTSGVHIGIVVCFARNQTSSQPHTSLIHILFRFPTSESHCLSTPYPNESAAGRSKHYTDPQDARTCIFLVPAKKTKFDRRQGQLPSLSRDSSDSESSCATASTFKFHLSITVTLLPGRVWESLVEFPLHFENCSGLHPAKNIQQPVSLAVRKSNIHRFKPPPRLYRR